MNHSTPEVDGYLRKNKKWQRELAELRRIVLRTPLTEGVKWRVPCYTLDGKNVVLLGAFKEFCAINFVKGALLKDPKGLLLRPGENTQAARWIKFTDVSEVRKLERALKALIDEAIEVEKSGLKVVLKKTADYSIPAAFQKKLDGSPALKAAFGALTPGRQRGYLLYFSGAKQSKTRESRIEKCMRQILAGKGLND